MPIFRTLIRGQNFVLALDGQPRRLGFFTTRFVQADDAAGAERAAVAAIRGDPELRANVRNARADPPMIFVDEIAPVDAAPDAAGSGFAFFPEEKPAEET